MTQRPRDALVRTVVNAWQALHGSSLFNAVHSAVQTMSGAQDATLVVRNASRRPVLFTASRDPRTGVVGIEAQASQECRSPAVRALTEGVPIIVSDVTEAAVNCSGNWCRAAAGLGVRSAAGLPIGTAAGAVAAVGLYDSRPGYLTEESLLRAGSLADAAGGILWRELMTRGLPQMRHGAGQLLHEAGAALRAPAIDTLGHAVAGSLALKRLAEDQGRSFLAPLGLHP